MDFQFEVTVTKKEWLSNPSKRWNAGLDRAGINYRQRLQRAHYPPIPPGSTYIRTGTLANKATYEIVEFGKTAELRGVFYEPYVLFGTSKWQGWPGKIDELKEYIQSGFKAGVKEFTE